MTHLTEDALVEQMRNAIIALWQARELTGLEGDLPSRDEMKAALAIARLHIEAGMRDEIEKRNAALHLWCKAIMAYSANYIQDFNKLAIEVEKATIPLIYPPKEPV